MSGAEMYLEEHRDQSLAELVQLLSIPSISTLPEHTDDVRHAAEWVARRLGDAGLEHVEIIPTGSQFVVYADWLHAPGRPTVLIYGHYDVQPVDPLGEWTSPPFSPTIREDRIYARGASDMKTNLLMSILGIGAHLHTAGALPINVKFILEGQEEIGSPGLAACVEAHPELFAADLLISADGGQWGEDDPALLLGTRGLVPMEIHVRAAGTDLHSGIYGGIIANPARALARIITSLHSADDTVLVAGFYDDVDPLTPPDRAAIREVPFDEQTYMRAIDAPALTGEPGYSALERLWVRPSLEVNGLWSGFQGDGVKTVLPSEAHAKITVRLAPHQEPERVAAQITAHVMNHVPDGVTVRVATLTGSSRPYYVTPEHRGIRRSQLCSHVSTAGNRTTPGWAEACPCARCSSAFWPSIPWHSASV